MSGSEKKKKQKKPAGSRRGAAGQEESRPPFLEELKESVRRDRKAFVVITILRLLIVVTLVVELFNHNYESVVLCVLALLIFLVPTILERNFRISIPPLFQVFIYLFVYASAILGEINEFYVRIPGWDTMLHTINGLLCAVIGFSTVQIMNRHSRNISLSPIYLAMVAFCFSMTVGVCWEFIEFFMDRTFGLDMQKDFIVRAFSSVSLNEISSNSPVHVRHITQTVISTEKGTQYVIDGYLDIGLIDTMKDLFVNFIGALVMSALGYIYIKFFQNTSRPVPEKYRREAESARRIVGDLVVRPIEEGEAEAPGAPKTGAAGKEAAGDAQDLADPSE